ncbi:MAG: hypothetical protein FJ291_16565 [Planctomycetes bacterium]|nr:hypothetical protein [Planctomycetota bacterium]
MANTRRFGWLVSLALVSFGRAAPGGEAPAGQAEILKKLDKPASLTLRGLPWDELFRELTDALECKIEVQKPFPETRSVWLWTHTLPGRAALDLICELIDRAWTLHGGSIVVAPREKVWELQRFPRREYDLTQAAREPKEAAGLQALIQKVLGPPSGTCGARVTLAGDARLAVAAPEADHKLVAKLLDAIRAVPRNGSVNLGTRAPSASRGRQLFESGREWPEWAQKKMEEQTTLDLTDAPLQKVLERLAKLRKTNILLRAGTVSPELPLTIKANDTRFKDALDWVNRAANLSYFVASDLIVFRPSEGSEEPEQPAPLAIAVHDFSGVVAQGWTMDEVMDFLRRYEAEEQPPEEEGGEKEKKAEEAPPKALVKGPGKGDLCLRLGTRAAVAAASGWRSHLAWVLPAMRERKNPPQRPGVTDSYAPAEEGICVREDDEEVSRMALT